MRLGVLCLVGMVACDCSSGGESDDASMSDAPRADVPTRDGSITPIPGEGECAWEPGERPSAELPPTHEARYELELERWEISNDAGDPVETRARINEAIAWATSNGFDVVVVPPGTYLVGEPTTDNYAAGIELVGDMTLELSDDTVIQMATNDRWNYCVIDLNGAENVTIRGGTIAGDRDTHDFEGGGAHDEGHGICAWTSVSRVLIEDVELRDLTGDGVLILGSRGDDTEPGVPSTNVTIRNSEIHHNRRQGVSIVGGHSIVVEDNHIHHIGGTAPQFGIDIEGAGRTDRDIWIHRNDFHDNAGGDIVTSSGRNVWIEGNTLTQCGEPCELEEQVDGPIVLWKETDNVVIDNTIRMSMRTVNGLWGIIGYTGRDGPTRENPVGNLIAGNVFHGAGIHMAHNMRTVIRDNTIHDGLILGFRLACTRLENNRINRTDSENYKLRDVAGTAEGNILNRTEGAPAEDDVEMHFPMADDAPYRNSSPVFW